MLCDTELCEQVQFIIGSIYDPQKTTLTLRDLSVINEGCVSVKNHENYKTIEILIVPTNPNCHLVPEIGLCIRYQLSLQLLHFDSYKIMIKCKLGSHEHPQQIEKQINDKQRIAAAFQNPEIKNFIHQLCKSL